MKTSPVGPGAVHEGHLELVLEVRQRAQPAHDRLRRAPGVIDQQAVERLDLHVRERRHHARRISILSSREKSALVRVLEEATMIRSNSLTPG